MKADEVNIMRHSLAHITAAAIQRLWPEAKFGVGPVVENGFYYDIDLGEIKISEANFPKIEKSMREIIEYGDNFEKFEMPIDQAITWAKDNKQPYKEELLNDLKRSGTTIAKELDMDEIGVVSNDGFAVKVVTFYKNGNFVDLCRGPHIANTEEAGAFKLMRVAGAYWRGKDTNPQMQRIYGVAFDTQTKLDEYLERLEQAKLRDHRKIGQELDLFVFSDLIGPGLPLFTPKGTILRRQLDAFVQQMRSEYGYQEVTTPHMTKKDAYVASGHWAKFQDELFKTTTREGHLFAIKPMSCPHHAQIYASRARSYKELPVRYRETAVCYRDEQSGELSGLSRVRSFAQDDAHVFCRGSQIKDEVLIIWNIIDRFYGQFGFTLQVRFSTHDSENMAAYSGTEEDWKTAEAQMLSIVQQKIGDNYINGLGEAAFYGPKIDFMATDAIGRTYQVATIQLDFNQPKGFNLTCTNEKGESERVTMIHAAIMGSIERFLSVYIEHTAGWFPFWLAPEQIRVLTINDTITDYVDEIKNILDKIVLMNPIKYNEIRYTVDDRNESLGKKIREATNWKIPIQLIVGPKDKDAHEVSIRTQSGEEKVKLDILADYIQKL